MPAGIGARFRILQSSPHDETPPQPASLTETESPSSTWKPSHYTIRASTDDGRLILWNTFHGSMSIFRADQATSVKKLLTQKGLHAPREGIVGYLAERGFLIPAESNEYRQVQTAIHQQQYRSDRLELILLASEDCNFRCKYCYEEFKSGTMLPTVRTGVKNYVEKALPRLTSIHLRWFGGEPLYGFEAIEDLAPYIKEVSERKGVDYSSQMTTNGYLLTPEAADKLFDWGINRFQITIDGLAQHHDKNRPTRDGRGTFGQIFENLCALSNREDDFLVNIRVNFDQGNVSQIPDFINELEDKFHGDRRFQLTLFPIGKWGGPKDNELEVCGTDQIEQVTRDFRAAARKKGIHVGTLKDINRLGADVCYAARPYNLIVGATGKLMKCTIALDTQDYNVVGVLHEDGTTTIDREKWALWTEPAFEGDRQCQKCVVLPLCQGTHCPMIRIEENRSPCTPLRLKTKNRLLETADVYKDGVRQLAVDHTTLRLNKSSDFAT